MQQVGTIRDDDSSSDFVLDHVCFATGSGGTVSSSFAFAMLHEKARGFSCSLECSL